MANPAGYYRALIAGETRGLWAALQRGALRTAGVFYGLAARLRNGLYDSGWKAVRRAPVPVVSVGNLTLGGTGKTPCVEWVADFYRRRGRRVAVLSRGYGGREGLNDEALVLRENLPDVPHFQGANRAALAGAAVREQGAEVLVLDDGFQHRRLARDLDVVLVDGTAPWGYGHLFPCGLLREAPQGLRRAGMVVLTRCDQLTGPERERLRTEIARLAPGVPVAEASHRPAGWHNARGEAVPVERLQGRSVAAFCGVGNPAAFRATLAGLGLDVIAFRTFPDHHGYPEPDVADLADWAWRLPADCALATTQKDLVKLRRPELGGKELWALRVRFHVGAGRDVFERKLLQVLRLAATGQGIPA